ncbi:hypothetical protein AB0N03_46275, partial [Amycolatopsis sp. NPDC051061]
MDFVVVVVGVVVVGGVVVRVGVVVLGGVLRRVAGALVCGAATVACVVSGVSGGGNVTSVGVSDAGLVAGGVPPDGLPPELATATATPPIATTATAHSPTTTPRREARRPGLASVLARPSDGGGAPAPNPGVASSFVSSRGAGTRGTGAG